MKINAYIDHTLLKATATYQEVEQLCTEALQYQFKSVCIPSFIVKKAHGLLANSSVKVCTVVGFPLGNSSTFAKEAETRFAVEQGADEIDMVINQSAIFSGDWEYVATDIRRVRMACKGKILKVILETCHLTDEEITQACKIAEKEEADFVKTSTGFATQGATFHAVQLMKEAVSNKVQIKASGGIRDVETAMKYIDFGVSRLGTSSGVAIIQGLEAEGSY